MHPTKAEYPIRVTELGTVILSNEVHSREDQPAISVTELGMVTLFSELHSRKAKSPIEVTELGMVMFSKEKQPAKAECPILVTELGIVTLSSQLFPSKASSSISVTEFGIDKFRNELRCWKALLPIRSEFGMANAWTLIIGSLFCRMWVNQNDVRSTSSKLQTLCTCTVNGGAAFVFPLTGRAPKYGFTTLSE